MPARSPPTKSIIPSKNALRALRRLAQSPPLYVAGALGSICGIASINYEVNRKICLAERLLERKKLIRSLSNGQGGARMKAMFDAAERGEDFTLIAWGSEKYKRPTSIESTPAVANPEPNDHSPSPLREPSNPEPDDHSPSPLPEPLVTPSSLPPPPPIPVAQSEFDSEPLAGRVTWLKAMNRPPSAPFSHDAPRRESHVLQMLTDASTQSETPIPAFQRDVDTKPRSEMRVQVPNEKQAETQLGSAIESATETPNESPVESQSPAVPLATDDGQVQLQNLDEEPAQLSQGRGSPDGIKWAGLLLYSEGALYKKYRVRRLHGDPFLMPAFMTAVKVHSSARSMQSQVAEEEDSPQDPILQDHESRLSSSELTPHFSHWATKSGDEDLLTQTASFDDEMALQQYLKTTAQDSVSDPTMLPNLEKSVPLDFLKYASQDLDWRTYVFFCEYVSATNEKLKNHTTYQRWLAVMQLCAGQSDWLMAEAIYYKYRMARFMPETHAAPVFDLIQHMLASKTESQRLQFVLFPNPKETLDAFLEEESSKAGFELAEAYLKAFCERSTSSVECVDELEKILDVTRNHGDFSNPCLHEPVVRAISRHGDLSDAGNAIDKLAALFPAIPAHEFWGRCALFKACDGNWGEVTEWMQRAHEVNVSRDRPVWYGSFYESILSSYAEKHSAVGCFRFTLDAIKYAGLIPLGLISRTLLYACIRDDRLDLVGEWARLVDSVFPRGGLGLDHRRGTWMVATALMEAEASCRTIMSLCLNIAKGCTQDPFGPGFREYCADLVRSDLIAWLQAARNSSPADLPSRNEIQRMGLNQLLMCAHDFCSAPSAATFERREIRDMKTAITAQLVAVVELVKIFKGDASVLFARKGDDSPQPLARRPASTPKRRPLRGAEAESTFPPIVTQEKMAYIGPSVRAVARHYAERAKQGLPADHSLLSYFVARFGRVCPSEVLDLVEAVYASKYVQGPHGTPFDQDFFVQWLRLVVTGKSVKAAVTALWAVVDSSRNLQWSAWFEDVCNFAAPAPASLVRSYLRRGEVGELAYLKKRIGRISSVLIPQQRTVDDFRFPRWQVWGSESNIFGKRSARGAIDFVNS